MNDWQRLKEINKKGLINSFLPGYKVNKWITNGFLFAAIFLILGAFYFEGNLTLEKKHYLTCETATPCLNPYYSPGWEDCPAGFDCSREYLNPGETWGKEPSKIYNWASPVFFVFILFGLCVNHIFYNRGYDFKNRFKKIIKEVRDYEDNGNGLN